jgi:hypothetical protein
MEDVCGAGCRVTRKLAGLSTAKVVALVDGTDPLESQPKTVVTTSVVFQTSEGWYGALLYRRGDGVEHLEIFNPPSMTESVSRAERPTKYSGATRAVRVVEDSGRATLVIELRRGQVTQEDALVLCQIADDGSPTCSELRTGADMLKGYVLEGGVLTARFDEQSDRYRVFGAE